MAAQGDLVGRRLYVFAIRVGQNIVTLARGQVNSSQTLGRTGGVCAVAQAMDCRTNIRVALEATTVVKGLRKFVRYVGSDDSDSDDSADAEKIRRLSTFQTLSKCEVFVFRKIILITAEPLGQEV